MDAWYHHPGTQYLIKELKSVITQAKDGWVSGQFTASSFEETIQLNAKAIGIVQSVEDVLALIEEIKAKGEGEDA